MYKEARDAMVGALESGSSVQLQAQTREDIPLLGNVSLDPGVHMGTDKFNACDGRASKLGGSRNSRTQSLNDKLHHDASLGLNAHFTCCYSKYI